MALIKVSKILRDAMENQYGVAAINVFNYESVKWAVMAAEEERMPIIIQFYPGFSESIDMDEICGITKKMAEKAIVPVGVHLDHSNSYEIALGGIAAGFPSVMVDGSNLIFEKNIELTKNVVRCAKAMGVDVESELGHVGLGMNIDDLTNKNKFTDPDQAVEFIEETQADSLAIAIGNGHGNYVKTPELDFDRISVLRSRLNIPLVMHGGSDIPDEQSIKAVKCGVSKFNIATEYQRVFYKSMTEFINNNKQDGVYIYPALRYLEKPCVDFIRNKIKLLNPNQYHV